MYYSPLITICSTINWPHSSQTRSMFDGTKWILQEKQLDQWYKHRKKSHRTWLLPRHTQHGTKADPEKASAQWRARFFSILGEGRTEGVTVRSKQTKTNIIGMVSSFVDILFWKEMLSTNFIWIVHLQTGSDLKCLVSLVVFGNTWVIHFQVFHVSASFSKKLAAYGPAMALGLEVSLGKAPWPQVSGLKVSRWHQWAVIVLNKYKCT